MNGKHFIGAKAQTANNVYTYPLVSKVILIVDDENVYMAGTDEGTVIEKECPYATQTMADNLLVMLQGYQYQSIEADAARITPTAELGDGITVNGIYTQLAYKNIRFSTGAVVDVAAPGSIEAEHEYQQSGSTSSDTSWKLAQTYSRISKTADEILLEVGSNMDDLSASIDIKIDGITSTVQGQAGQISQISQTVDSISSTVQGQGGQISSINQTLTNINSTIRGLDGDISEIDQKVDSIRLGVSNGSTSSTITLTVDGVQVSSQNITMSGLVTYTGLSNGTTTINGACIKTGTIDADRLNLTGAITFSDLSSSTQSTINTASTNASNALSTANGVSATLDDLTVTQGYTTYIDGSRIETSELYVNSANITGTITAEELRGSTVSLIDRYEEISGYLDIDSADSADYAISLESNAALRLVSNRGAIHFESNYRAGRGDITVDCASFSPLGFAANLGDPYVGMWEEVFAYTSEINTSDANFKNSIETLPSKYITMLDNITPVRYKMNNGTSDRYHTGFIAQDVKAAMDKAEISDMEFAGWCKDTNADGEEIYLLRYSEMIALLLAKIKQLEAEIKTLEGSA